MRNDLIVAEQIRMKYYQEMMQNLYKQTKLKGIKTMDFFKVSESVHNLLSSLKQTDPEIDFNNQVVYIVRDSSDLSIIAEEFVISILLNCGICVHTMYPKNLLVSNSTLIYSEVQKVKFSTIVMVISSVTDDVIINKVISVAEDLKKPILYLFQDFVSSNLEGFIRPWDYLLEINESENESDKFFEDFESLCHTIAKSLNLHECEKLDKNGFKVYPRQIVIQAYYMMLRQQLS